MASSRKVIGPALVPISTHNIDGTKSFINYDRTEYSHGGFVDWGNLMNITPYLGGGYCLFVVLSAPEMFVTDTDRELQSYFINSLEIGFAGLSGIPDKQGESTSFGPSHNQLNLITSTSGLNGPAQISVKLAESTGLPISKYLSLYLDKLNDQYMQVRNYKQIIGQFSGSTNRLDPYKKSHSKEVFNFLYIVTDETFLNIEKAFFLLAAQPTGVNYSDLFTGTRGVIETKEIDVNFNCIIRESGKATEMANKYVKAMVNTSAEIIYNKININSLGGDYTVSGMPENMHITGTLKDIMFLDDPHHNPRWIKTYEVGK